MGSVMNRQKDMKAEWSNLEECFTKIDHNQPKEIQKLLLKMIMGNFLLLTGTHRLLKVIIF